MLKYRVFCFCSNLRAKSSNDIVRSIRNWLADLVGVWVQPSDCPSCGKTLDANLAQVTAGMAWWYRYYAKEQPVQDRGRYESAEDEAKARGLGLWADPNPINPYEWREANR